MNDVVNTSPIKYPPTVRIILIGVFMGLIISVFDNVFIPFLLPISFSFAIHLCFKNNPRVRNILLVALWARIFLSLIYYFYVSSQPSLPFKGIAFGPDGELYAGHAWWVSVLNTGRDIIKNNLMRANGFFSDIYVFEDYVLRDKYIPMSTYEVGFFAYLMAVVYAIFGYCPLLLNFINCVLGVLIGYFSYLIALQLFDKRAAYIALIITLFFPTLFIWSALTKLREPLYILLTLIFILLNIKFIKEKKFYYLALNLIIMIFAELVKKRIIFIFNPVFFITLFLAIPIRLKRKIQLVLVFIILIKIMGLDIFLINKLKAKIRLLTLIHIGAVTSGGVGYKLLNDIAYIPGYELGNLQAKDYFIYYPKALWHFFFEPFPSHILSIPILFFTLQQGIWFFLLLFFVCGLITSFKKNGPQHAILLIYFFLMVSSVAMAEGNIGTLIRHRDAITPIVIIFASAGIVNLFLPGEKEEK